MKLLAIRAVMRMFSWISPRAAEYIAPALAALVWYSVPRLRRVTRINLKAVYPDMDAQQRKKIGRDSMTHYARGIFEAGMLWHWPLEKMYPLFDEVQGMEEVEELIKLGKGLIVAAPHYGSWEMLNLFLHSKGEAAILYKPTKFPEIDALLREKRARAGAEMVAANGKGIRRMYQLLKDGYFVALLPDQEPTGGGGKFAPFLVSKLCQASCCRVWHNAPVPRWFLPSVSGVRVAGIVFICSKRTLPFTVKTCVKH